MVVRKMPMKIHQPCTYAEKNFRRWISWKFFSSGQKRI